MVELLVEQPRAGSEHGNRCFVRHQREDIKMLGNGKDIDPSSLEPRQAAEVLADCELMLETRELLIRAGRAANSTVSNGIVTITDEARTELSEHMAHVMQTCPTLGIDQLCSILKFVELLAGKRNGGTVEPDPAKRRQAKAAWADLEALFGQRSH